jgi:hypothetical protein
VNRFTVHDTLARVRRRISLFMLEQPHLAGADPRDLQSRVAALSGSASRLTGEDALRLAAFSVLHLLAVERAERVRVDTGDAA